MASGDEKISRVGDDPPSEDEDRHDGSRRSPESAEEAGDDTVATDAESQRPSPDADEAASRVIPDTESMLFLSDPHAEGFFDDADPSIVMDSAAFVLQRLDPLKQEGAYEDEAGNRFLPGIVSLTPISLAAFFLNCGALVGAMAFAILYAPAYLIALSIFHTVIFGNLWTYYVAYRTQRRWLQFRQFLFIVVLIAFVQWMFVDLLSHPPQSAAAKARIGSGYEMFIWLEIVINTVIAGLIAIHWLLLGRGYREVEPDADLRWWRRNRGVKRHASTAGSRGS